MNDRQNISSIPWPEDGLEHVCKCSVCGCEQRSLLHSGLIDNVFFCAKGKWDLWRCLDCASGYLDPRPNEASIHMAYENYYTHTMPAKVECVAKPNSIRALGRQLMSGYIRWRYVNLRDLSGMLGFLAISLLKKRKRSIDEDYRHLPKLPKSGGKLLDVGCGDGSFLKLAADCGWDVCGLDPDPKAVSNASKLGLIIHKGGLEQFNGKTELFDVITLSHVIEHVHDPLKMLQTCHGLLKRDGVLWLQTPNIDSFGHAFFKNNWRGLESPRHIIIFSLRSLHQSVRRAGFTSVHDLSVPSACANMYRKSYSMTKGFSPYDMLELPNKLKIQAKIAAFAEILLPSRREFHTLIAHKSGN